MIEFDPPPSNGRLALAVGLMALLTAVAVGLVVHGVPSRPVEVVLGVVCVLVNALVVWR